VTRAACPDGAIVVSFTVRYTPFVVLARIAKPVPNDIKYMSLELVLLNFAQHDTLAEVVSVTFDRVVR
jgi:hypothetical protein